MFPFGITFYPDLLPKEEWENTFLKIYEAGFNAIRFGEMAWGNVEPRSGDFKWDDLDQVMALAAKYGLKVLLGIPTAAAPQWLVARNPSVRPMASDGALAPEYGPRPNACKDDKAYRKFAERMAEKLVKRYSDHPALLCWQLDNEPCYPPLDLTWQKDFCHCESTNREFALWAEARYRTLDELNRAWGTKFWSMGFSSFDDIRTPKVGFWDGGNPHIYLDWFRFKSDSLSSWLKRLKEIVKRTNPRNKVGTNSFIDAPNRIPDHDILADGLDWYGWDIYPKGTANTPDSLAQHADFWRSIATGRGAEFIVSELQAGPNVRWGNPADVYAKEIRTWTHQFVAHGARGILYHAWRPPLIGSETGGFGLLYPDGTRTERLSGVEIVAKEIKKIEDLLSSHKLMPQVAIAYLKSSDVETFQEQGFPRGAPAGWIQGKIDMGVMHGLDSIAGAHKVLWRHINPTAFIFERTLGENTPPFEAVLLTNPYLLKEKDMKVLRKYVYDGGILITEARFGLKDEFAHLWDRPLSEKFFDVAYEKTEAIGDPIGIEGMAFNAYGYRDIVSVKEGVLLSYKDGRPALIEKKIGKGRALYATFSLFLSLIKQERTPMVELLRKYLPRPNASLKAGEAVEMIYWADSTPIIYVINHGDLKESVEIEPQVKYGKAEDILYGKRVEILEGRIRMELEPREVVILHLSEVLA